MFMSFILNSVVTVIWLSTVPNNQELVASNPVSITATVAHQPVQALHTNPYNRYNHYTPTITTITHQP